MKKILTLILLFITPLLFSQNDCVDALIVCGNSGYQDLEVTSAGIQELNGSNSCASSENNSVWFKLNIKTGGTLGFTLTPNSTSIFEDFDFFIFGPNVTCGNIGQAIRCSTTNPRAASQGNNLTGMNGTETETSEGPGTDGNSFVKWLDVLANESYFLVIDRPIGNSNFSIEWTGTASFSEQPTFETPISSTINLEQCDSDLNLDEVSLFNLTQNDTKAIGTQSNVVATYHTSNNDALIGINEIVTPNLFENTSNPQTLYIRLTNTITECFSVSDFTVTVTTIPIGTAINLTACDDDNDGFYTFDLSQNDTNINLDLVNNTINYFDNETDALTNNIANKLPTNYTNSTAFTSEIIWARVQNTISGCYNVTSFSILVYKSPDSVQPTDIIQCDDDFDGFYQFDIANLKDSEILGTQSPSEFEISYFTNQIDADNNTIANAITNPYTNSSSYSVDTIIARVQNIQNQECYETLSFTLHLFETPNPPSIISVLGKCDNTSIGTDTDNLIIFDLTEKESEILNGQAATDFTISYFSDASLLNPILNPSAFPNTTTLQPIYVRIVNNFNSNCTAISNFNIEAFQLPTITSNITLKQCDDNNDGFSIFNLNEANTKISTNAINEVFTYFNTPLGADTNDSAELILNPTTYNSAINTDIVWARVENTNGCHRVSKVDLIVSTTTIPSTFQRAFFECDDYVNNTDDEKDGVTTFDFSSVNNEIIALFPVGQQLFINYYRNEADALAEENAILDIANYRNIGYPITQTIYVRVDSQLDNDCLGLGAHITLHVEPIPIANTVTIDRQCDDDFDGYFPFNTTTIETTILGTQTGMLVTYFEENGNALPLPLPNPLLINSQTITIRVTDSNSVDPDGSCFAETTLQFIVDKKPVANPIPNFIECDDDLDGMYNFDTSTIQATALNTQTGMVVSYTDENGNSLPSPLPNPFFTATQTITVQVKNGLNSNCMAETTFEFIVNPTPEFEIDATAIYCQNLEPITISPFNELGNYTYEWNDENGQIISTNRDAIITSEGEYTAIATSNKGCKSFPQTIIVEASIIATLTPNDVTIIDDSENNSITISTTNLGIGDYEFALQKIDEFISTYQDEPYFEQLAPGIYTIFIRDKNNCGVATLDVSVIGFPKFFTPNNDGSNDTWVVLGVNENFYASSTIYIFDRFGKLITQVNPKGEGWNGFLNGKQVPSTDYWFSVELIDNNGNVRLRKGHFSLIRR